MWLQLPWIDFKYVMLLLITNTKVNTFSTWCPPPSLFPPSHAPKPAGDDSHNLLGRHHFPISTDNSFQFPPASYAQISLSRHILCLCISLAYIVYTVYSISIWTVNNAAGWAKWRRHCLLACLPSSPASALNSLTISTIKMCQKIFQFPYTQEGMYERGRGWERGAGRRLLLEAYTFQFS